MFKTLSIAAAVVGFAATLSAQTPEPADTFKVNYYSNAQCPGAPDGTVRITNVGTQIGAPGNAAGDMFAVIFVLTPDQQLAECCGCLVTPDGLLTLSINDDLTSNPLTRVIPTTGDIKIIGATLDGGPAKNTPIPGIRAWGTHIQKGFVTETPFSDSTLSAGELKQLTNKCNAIFNNGSGHGICTCGTGEFTTNSQSGSHPSHY